MKIRIVFLTSIIWDYHGCYKKSEGQLWWWQYYTQSCETYYLFGWLPIWCQMSPRVDEPMYKLLRRAFGE